MSESLSPLDIHLRISASSGWVGDRPRLERAQLDELAELIKPPLDAAAREKFERFVQNIYAFAVEGLLTQRRYDGRPVVAIRDRLGRFLQEMERAETAINGMDEGVRSLIDDELTDFALAGKAPLDSPYASIESWRSAMSKLIGVIVMASRRLDIVAVKGEGGAVYRQMVRGLLSLVYDVTGEVPKRSTARRRAGESSVEDYWFLRLSQRLADHVFIGVEARIASQAKSFAEGDAKRAPRASRAAPKSSTATKQRNRAGPPALSMIVRQELKALQAEIAKKSDSLDAG